ncbi:MAG TPA: ATP-dependent DNA helicase UvrD2 [Methylomirabilota bacterium]|nr:ATP-dependent DNA helicase UvrD2 [Methylomirabilota bacterium]
MSSSAPADRLLDDLNDAQLEAVRAVDGPLAIIAGAGTGKTRVISRRTAFAIASGAVPADQVLVVTFTDKAAGEMMQRLRGLGLPGVTARTVHAHALSQLRHFWPLRHDGAPLPEILDSKLPILIRLARGLPGHYRFTAAKDLADEIEWAKSRQLDPRAYGDAVAADREPPIPVDLFIRVFGDYERAKTRAGRIDFDDMLGEAIRLLEDDREATATIRSRKRWFSVDEYQDTSPLQERLLELWLGDGRDICVVGDEDQTIYTFAGASSTFLTTFADRHDGARVVALTENYRSSPEVLEFANRLIASSGRTKRLTATKPSGPQPTIAGHRTAEAELAALVAWVRRLVAGGTPAPEIAVLVRMNAQLEPIETALTRAGIGYRVRGVGFYRRPDVRAAIELVRRGRPAAGTSLGDEVRTVWARELGHDERVAPAGEEARERSAALDTLLGILDDLVAADPETDRAAFLGELERRAATERAGGADGIELATYHRAKGLEWDAVYLPMLEEGSLPIRQALDDEDAIDEERRLLYVGITRARLHLALSWADQRETRGRDTRRKPSRFLAGLVPRRSRAAAGRDSRDGRDGRDGRAGRGGRVVILPDGFAPASPRDGDSPLLAALRTWRTGRARGDAVPAFVVAHDSTLASIAEAQPETLAALRRVRGMGPAKLEKYGPEILTVIARASEDGTRDGATPADTTRGGATPVDATRDGATDGDETAGTA